ncbi:MAG: septum site-determining protein MinD, partial [Clostridia bacterium]|nr:septum site-determining protein MinD [Clostridia bacterium]
KLRPKMVENGSMLGIEDMLDILAIDLLGVVPDDEDIIVAANRGEYVSAQNSSRAGQAYRNIAARLNGEEVELMNMKETFFSKLFARRRGGQK